ncbi:MAG: DUF368 domain-containing protein [Clostridia bacterium]|nr:DUF368 domain-containing protein [Clostridia bacterium]
MEHIINFFKGMIIGISNVIPGVSGGTMAVSMGIYEKLVQTIGNFFHHLKENFKKNMIFLLPIVVGAGIGIIAFSKLIKFLLENYAMQTQFAFIGLILGSMPFIMKKSVSKGFSWKYLIPGILTFGIGLTLAILEILGITGNTVDHFDITFINIILLFIYGMISAVSMVVPGISGSFILLLLGVYSAIISAISSLNVLVLLPFGIGVVIGILLASKIIDFLLERFYGYTYFAIIGFVIGSLLAIYPGFSFDIAGVVSIICLAFGFASSFFISKYTNKEE